MPSRPLSHLVRGDRLNIGGEFGSGATVVFDDSTKDGATLDAAVTIRGSLTVLGNLSLTGSIVLGQAQDFVAQGNTQIGDAISPGNLTVFSASQFKENITLDAGKKILPLGAGTEIGSVANPIENLWARRLFVANLEQWVKLNLVGDAVAGQPNAYYIDKGITSHGYNVALDLNGKPMVSILVGGQGTRWVPEGSFPDGDFSVVRSQSTGPEGPAAVGSHNAIRFVGPLPTGVDTWYFYLRDNQATP